MIGTFEHETTSTDIALRESPLRELPESSPTEDIMKMMFEKIAHLQEEVARNKAANATRVTPAEERRPPPFFPSLNSQLLDHFPTQSTVTTIPFTQIDEHIDASHHTPLPLNTTQIPITAHTPLFWLSWKSEKRLLNPFLAFGCAYKRTIRNHVAHLTMKYYFTFLSQQTTMELSFSLLSLISFRSVLKWRNSTKFDEISRGNSW
ncbi:uncharacterized protein LOC132636010 isoform X2 [Lycium barbarum]|nr:uncharacterized protein LOC132636010 isoform X2 [Lycium barbarum]